MVFFAYLVILGIELYSQRIEPHSLRIVAKFSLSITLFMKCQCFFLNICNFGLLSFKQLLLLLVAFQLVSKSGGLLGTWLEFGLFCEFQSCQLLAFLDQGTPVA